jgi:DNA-binding transcriptional MerR regulator
MMKRKSTSIGMRSGELAAAAGVSADTLRHYEREGLLPPSERLPNGYRVYAAASLKTVLLIQRALSIGFSLAEIAVFLKERRNGSPPCKRVHALALDRLADVERRIASLTHFRDEFRAVLNEWNGRIAGTPEGSPARLLESLAARPDLLGSEFREKKFVHRGKSTRRS